MALCMLGKCFTMSYVSSLVQFIAASPEQHRAFSRQRLLLLSLFLLVLSFQGCAWVCWGCVQ
jgi:hypothetical protein